MLIDNLIFNGEKINEKQNYEITEQLFDRGVYDEPTDIEYGRRSRIFSINYW